MSVVAASVRKLSLSLTAAAFAAAYLAGACTGALAIKRRFGRSRSCVDRRPVVARPLRPADDTAEALVRCELANWARQAMFDGRSS